MAAKKQWRAEDQWAPDRVQINNASIDYCRNFLSIVYGIAAGVLGLTGLWGFALHIVCSILISAGLYLKAGMDPSYFMSVTGLFVSGLTGGMGTYILVWTMAYDVVHVYG
mmetsp:Transcript_114393/g.171065  ORF Transcript_114393/g.171065 Transcript_114393/m.171065 type:complete len:110 (-) Transcript_114393:158-487(-)